MSLAAVTRRAWRDNHLLTALVELTYRCNLDCFFCYNDLGLRGRAMTTAGWLRLFDELAEMQVLHLVLTGGEPLAHPDFLALGARARRLGFVVRIKSNGHALRGRLARRIRDEVDPFVIEVSLHGARAETHDRQTRVPGSFDRLLANLDEMRRLGLRVKVNSTLTRWNEDEVGEMFALTDRLGLALRVDPEVTPRDDGDREPLAVTPSRDGVRRLFRLLAERAATAAVPGRPEGAPPPEANGRPEGDPPPAATAYRPESAPGPLVARPSEAPALAARPDDDDLPAPAGKHCGAGSSGIAVDPFGNVYPCVQWRRPVGNLHQLSIREIWESATGLAEVRELTAEAARRLARLGPGAAALAFCPGSAATRTGDPLALYPEAVRRAELAGELERGEDDRAPDRRRPLLPVVS